ncbi:LysR family transcriptional regulator [Pantoea sp. Bo_2]|uniref:LysR substrate-binding domain-containing protein n=1 Tax=unclassified Pantoea TaxID=2630326 RepID=UPI001231C359|nr:MULTISPECIES: LysR substrate-binding domain-containing protein [unclassified Pantoea]KAA5948252.1 LysR family transcriptional regulator [Pantoea sp. VH_3]KAA5953522.1 LysR family transcriptional regulator [Pantoea sp. VH_25]KAA5985378.1 LysR family transcriptional regulator [Pantoea sp. M_3]KAA6047348.1 LysR family transcriptional regulator [Pantoea sp. FN_2b]KAA6052573.1 LysR family transcriptional regulator [Pantoea sp. Bo_5]
MPAQLPRLPKISVIQSFKVAAELGSLAKAAAQLALTPAAVSQQIRQLEEQLGSALFLRTQSGVMLTETGKEYLRYVTEAFDILHLGQQNIRHAASAPKLTIYALPALASKWLLPELASWRDRCPDIAISLNGTHSPVDFTAMPADFVICFGEDRYPQLDKIRLFQDDVLPVASPALLQRVMPESILSQAPLIHLDWGNEGRFLPDWQSWVQAKGMDEPLPQPAFSFNLTSLAIDAAVAGMGLLLGQRRLIAPELARGDLVVVDDLCLPLSKPYFLAWPQRTLSQPGSEAMIGWLKELGARC